MTRRSRLGIDARMTEKPKPPSFDDIMKAASRPPEPVRKEVRKPVVSPAPAEAKPRKPSAPTFAEIIGSVELRPEDRAPRPPPRGKRKEERKAPVVVRKPQLGKVEEQTAPPPAGASQEREGAQHPHEHAATPEQPARPVPESSFAQPGADESADFGALLAESEKAPRKQEKLRLGQKVAARVAHVGAEIAYLDLGGKGEAIIDLRELRNEKGELV